ncbi:MAG TPA: helix-turn-helix domain-containing protein [Ktedonobacteraceae bacterium]|jgi:excisionase family DNA binding protein|nr:helix-turn-helix domain-containing protein [Ktedonobacteraceae bacterium]
MQDDIYLTVEEIARQLKVSPDTVRRWIREGRLPAIDLIGQYRIKREDYERFLEQRRKGR